jgi:hypothetical protein
VVVDGQLPLEALRAGELANTKRNGHGNVIKTVDEI